MSFDDESEKKKLRLITIIISSVVIAVIGLILVFQMISWNEADERIVHQSAFNGDLTVIESAGPYMKAFGTTTIYKKVISVNFSGDAEVKASSIIPLIPIRFLDTTTGDARGVARFRLPGHVAAADTGILRGLLKIHEEFGSQETLVSNLLVRTVTENVKASARMMSVEQHYSGGNGQLSQNFSDQLQNGIYVTEQKIEQAAQKGEDDSLSQRQRVTIEIKKDPKTQELLRNDKMLSDYAIAVVDASIIDIDYETKVDARLEAQKQAAADEALSRQNLKKAEQAAKTEVAQGAQRIAKQRADSEVLKTKEMIDAERVKANAIIAAEQRVSVKAQLALEQTQILKQQKLEAQGMDVLAAARRRAKTSALDPKYVFDETLKAKVTMNRDLYSNMKSAQLVPLVVSGSGGKGGVNAISYLEVMANKAALDLARSLKTK